MNEIPQELEGKNDLRLIFLNLLISAFIIISYIYIAEAFGSISSVFIESQEFFVRFGITLLIFTFLSVLAGSLHGLIDGFLAELLYQLAYYHEIYFEWCLIVAILGFLFGIYKYKPLKYHEGKKVCYTFLTLLINSLIIMSIIIVFQILFYPGQFKTEVIFVNFGLKFFIQATLSIIFIVPIVLIIYDKIFASEEKDLYYMLLTHHPVSASDHTFYFKFGRTRIYFCSRCSGVIIGGLIGMFMTHMIEKSYNVEFSPEIALLLCMILPIPGIIDWGTQRLLLRKSTTESRLFTGFIIGAALHLTAFTYKYYFFTMLIITIYFIVFFTLVYFGYKKEMKLLKKDLKRFSPDEQDDY